MATVAMQTLHYMYVFPHLPSVHFVRYFVTKILYAFHALTISFTCSIHCSFLKYTIQQYRQITFGDFCTALHKLLSHPSDLFSLTPITIPV